MGCASVCTKKGDGAHVRALLDCCSVAQSCLTLCDSMDCSSPSLGLYKIIKHLCEIHRNQAALEELLECRAEGRTLAYIPTCTYWNLEPYECIICIIINYIIHISTLKYIF